MVTEGSPLELYEYKGYLSSVLCTPALCEVPGKSDYMAYLTPIGVQAGADATVSELLAHWIAEQQQRDGLCQRERPRIGILAAQAHLARWVLPWDMVDKSTSSPRTYFGPVLDDFAVQRGLHFPE
jgi:hypothetical protein